MAKDKSLMVTHRTHAILERELITRRYEVRDTGDELLNWKSLLTAIAEKIQETREFADLPEKDV